LWEPIAKPQEVVPMDISFGYFVQKDTHRSIGDSSLFGDSF
jgi:hypothetical protein